MNELECSEYYYKTGKIPPVNLNTWVSVYLLITSAGFNDDKTKL